MPYEESNRLSAKRNVLVGSKYSAVCHLVQTASESSRFSIAYAVTIEALCRSSFLKTSPLIAKRDVEEPTQ